MQLRLRRFLAEYNQRSGVTVILTSHYMADVLALCPRVVLIHHGKLLYDGELNRLARQLLPFKMVRMTLGIETFSAEDLPLSAASFPAGVEITETGSNTLTLRVPRPDAPTITARLLQTLPVVDLTVEDPPIEAVIDQVYSEGAA
jgi:ABC-2 type transport system ATP-binding protein